MPRLRKRGNKQHLCCRQEFARCGLPHGGNINVFGQLCDLLRAAKDVHSLCNLEKTAYRTASTTASRTNPAAEW